MQWYTVVLAYLKVILSWPVMAFAIALLFRKELQRLPGRLEQVVWGRHSKRLIFSQEQSRRISRNLDKAFRKPSISKKQQGQLQKDIDNVFELGVAVGLANQGQAFGNIGNVQLIKDQKGDVTGLQYNEK